MAISTQYQNLNLIPGKSAPVVVHCSQGNVGDTVGFYLYDGDEPFYPTNVSIAVHGVRADGSVFGPYTVAVTSGSNLVTFDLVTAMTSVAGAAIGELVITDSGENQVGSANFGLLVETTPYSSTVTYEDDLSIYQRILAYVQSIPAELSGQIATEAETRAAADTALQNGIDTEASARSSADTSLQSQINAEAATRASADSNLQAQINQIVAPSGSAPSAAEVQNARIGYDETTYTTLGDAIRTQVSNIHDEINLNAGLVQKSTYSFTFSAGQASTERRPLQGIALKAGIYVYSCVQSAELSSATRNCLFYQRTDVSGQPYIYETNTSYLKKGLHVWIIELANDGTYDFWLWVNNPSSAFTLSDFRISEFNLKALAEGALKSNLYVLPATMNDAKNGVYYYNTMQSEIPNEDGQGVLIAVTSTGGTISQHFISDTGNTYFRRYTGSYWSEWKTKFYAYYKNMDLGDGFGFLKESAYNSDGSLRLQEYYDWHNKLMKLRYYSSGTWKDWVTFKPKDYTTNYSGFLPCKKELSFDTEYNATMGQGIAVYNDTLFAIYNRTDGTGISVYSMTETESDGSLKLITRDLTVSIGHGNAIQFGQVLDGAFPHLFVSGWDDGKVYEIKYSSGTFTQVAVHNLPSGLAYTSVAVNELEDTFYIFNCDEYPEVLKNYDFIKWNYKTQTVISQRKTEPFMTMQDCEYACGCIMVTGGYGQASNPSTCYVYDLNGNRIGSVALNSRLSTTEIEGVTYDPITGELYLGQAYYMYRVRS